MADKPIEIILADPARGFAQLYNFARFVDKHPVRVTIPVVPGFKKAVVVAAALQFAVRLDVGQPDATVMQELIDSLQLYLHDRNVRQPIEFFHSSLYAIYHRARITLWDIAEKPRTTAALPRECAVCEYARHCDGFFKSPRRDYDCSGVKEIFAALTQAAAELRLSAMARS
jgi:hypothetical protein